MTHQEASARSARSPTDAGRYLLRPAATSETDNTLPLPSGPCGIVRRRPDAMYSTVRGRGVPGSAALHLDSTDIASRGLDGRLGLAHSFDLMAITELTGYP